MKKSFVLLAVLSIILSSAALGFDGNRKGFVLGGGLGLSPAATWDGDPVPSEFLKIPTDIDAKTNIVQGFNGVSWYHYFGSKGQTFFTALGAGVYVFDLEVVINNVTVSGSNDPAFGMLIGAGYEFSPHYQVGGYFSFGNTTEPGIEYKHAHLNILFSVMAF